MTSLEYFVHRKSQITPVKPSREQQTPSTAESSAIKSQKLYAAKKNNRNTPSPFGTIAQPERLKQKSAITTRDLEGVQQAVTERKRSFGGYSAASKKIRSSINAITTTPGMLSTEKGKKGKPEKLN